jgi:hypothetical protein
MGRGRSAFDATCITLVMMIAGRGLCVIGLLFAFVLLADALRDHLVRCDSLRANPCTELGSHSGHQPPNSPNKQFRDAPRGTIATTPAPRSEAVVVRGIPIHRRGVDLDHAGHRQRSRSDFRPNHLQTTVLLI